MFTCGVQTGMFCFTALSFLVSGLRSMLDIDSVEKGDDRDGET